MAGRLLTISARALRVPRVPLGAKSYSDANYTRMVIGNRDIVGYGFNGEPSYVDRPDFPMPSIRWKENTPDVLALREKEKGDWRKLSKEEKKQLYRASFKQTFAEFKAPTGEWKSVFGMALFFCSLGIWVYMGMKLFVYNPLPETFEEDRQKAQLRRMIDIQANPITGLASKWDYEKDTWKK